MTVAEKEIEAIRRDLAAIGCLGREPRKRRDDPSGILPARRRFAVISVEGKDFTLYANRNGEVAALDGKEKLTRAEIERRVMVPAPAGAVTAIKAAGKLKTPRTASPSLDLADVAARLARKGR